MKEVEKKDAPEVSGGQIAPSTGWVPVVPFPIPGYPTNPIVPRDPLDPLGDGVTRPQVNS